MRSIGTSSSSDIGVSQRAKGLIDAWSHSRNPESEREREQHRPWVRKTGETKRRGGRLKIRLESARSYTRGVGRKNHVAQEARENVARAVRGPRRTLKGKLKGASASGAEQTRTLSPAPFFSLALRPLRLISEIDRLLARRNSRLAR